MLIDIQRSLYDIYNNEMLKKIKRPYPTSLTKTDIKDLNGLFLIFTDFIVINFKYWL